MQSGKMIGISDREVTVQMLDGSAHVLAGLCGYAFGEECVWLYAQHMINNEPMGFAETYIFPLMNVVRVVIGAREEKGE